jgi:hypothetical protein
MIRVILAALLMVLLTSCVFGNPNQAVVKQAIALEVTQTQENIGQLLYSSSAQLPQFKINRVNITEQKPITIEDLKGYQVQGTYDVTLNFSDRQVTQRKNPFTVYLQQQADNETWRLAHPQPGSADSEKRWITRDIELQ